MMGAKDSITTEYNSLASFFMKTYKFEMKRGVADH